MNDHALFLGKFLRYGTAIASVAPSSRWLSRATVRGIDWDAARTVVELGAGTGPITRVIAENASPTCQVIVIERDPDFAAKLRDRFGGRANFSVIEGDVSGLPDAMARLGVGRVDHFVSGLPVPSFPDDLRRGLFRAVAALLASGGTYRQITEIPWLYQGLYRRYFDEARFVFEPRNIPPSGVYHCRGVKAEGFL